MTGFLVLTGLLGLGIGVWLGMPGRYTQTPEDIDRAMDGNICRCGMYGRIKAAIKTAAASGDGDATEQGDA